MKRMWKPLAWVIICLSMIYVGFRLDVKGFFQSHHECPFCCADTLNKQAFIIEDGVMGVVPYKPVVDGHVLVVVQRHVERFEDLSDQEIQAVGSLIRKIHFGAQQMFHKNDYLILQKNGKSAGQSVPHVHFHYFPRQASEGHFHFLINLFWKSVARPVSDKCLVDSSSAWRSEMRSIDSPK